MANVSHADAPRALEATEARTEMVRAWDLPTRLFKWTLVTLVLMAPISQWFGDVTLVWHKWNGYAILILLVFRLLWGVVGSSTARFRSWVKMPWTALRYGYDTLLKGRRRPYLGHNPLGGYMILALLFAVGLQAATGLFTNDSNNLYGGPLAANDGTGDGTTPLIKLASSIHYRWYYWAIIALVVVHVAVNLYYQFVKRDHLISGMVKGVKPAEPYEDEREMRPASALAALACLGAAAAIVLGGVKLAGGSLF